MLLILFWSFLFSKSGSFSRTGTLARIKVSKSRTSKMLLDRYPAKPGEEEFFYRAGDFVVVVNVY